MGFFEDAGNAFVKSTIREAVERAVTRGLITGIHARTGALPSTALAFLARRDYAIAPDEGDRADREGEREALAKLGYLKKGFFGWKRTAKPTPGDFRDWKPAPGAKPPAPKKVAAAVAGTARISSR